MHTLLACITTRMPTCLRHVDEYTCVYSQMPTRLSRVDETHTRDYVNACVLETRG